MMSRLNNNKILCPFFFKKKNLIIFQIHFIYLKGIEQYLIRKVNFLILFFIFRIFNINVIIII